MDDSIKDASHLSYSGFSPPISFQPLHKPVIISKSTAKLGRIATRTDAKLRHLFAHEHEVKLADFSSYEAQTVNLPSNPTLPLSSISTADSAQLHREFLQKANQAADELAELSKNDDPVSLLDPNQERIDGIKQVIAQSNEVLASASTVFPFTLFRDDIVLDRTKVTITKRNFFFSSEVMSIRIEDILNVKVTIGPFFGSITLVVRVMSTEDHHTINYFYRKDATHLKHIIQGYIIAQHNNIDLHDQSKQDLIRTLSELGHDNSR